MYVCLRKCNDSNKTESNIYKHNTNIDADLKA